MDNEDINGMSEGEEPSRFLEQSSDESFKERYEENALFGPNPYARNYRDLVFNDEGLMDAIKELTLQATLEAIEEKDANCVSNHIGVRSHQLRAKYGIPRLRLHSPHWERDDADGQVRFKNTADYPFTTFLIMSSGWRIPGAYYVHPKGANTRAITIANQRWSSQGVLREVGRSSLSRDDHAQYYWVFVDHRQLPWGDWWIVIDLGLPHFLSRSGQTMGVIDRKTIFEGPATLGITSLDSALPPAEVADVDISDLEKDECSAENELDDHVE